MGLEKETEIQGGKLTYEVRKDDICIKSCKVILSRVIIPPTIDRLPVTEIDKKAFLSCKALREIRLPQGLAKIGDWAFAYCSELAAISLPRRNLSMGKGVFKDCHKLENIRPLDLDGQYEEQVGWLLGAVCGKLEADYLFTPGEAGQKEWLLRFDDKLREFLAAPDEDGFVKMVYCGEEDIVANVEFYLAERRREKARLCYLRLINDVGLTEGFRQELEAYLSAHTKDCASEAAWEVVFGEHGNERSYYETFARAGCLNQENYDGILLEMGENFPEMKAFLMRRQSRQGAEEDFFAGLSLD
ncbi:MAG: leucine-rich repeat domain-containing protein [Lachnospiraceae bacterium]|nr:leucine-rich repeat domain-containing protein [Lachnospiraceae bacterium]